MCRIALPSRVAAADPGQYRCARSSSLPDTHEAVRAAAAEVEGHVDLAFLFLSRARGRGRGGGGGRARSAQACPPRRLRRRGSDRRRMRGRGRPCRPSGPRGCPGRRSSHSTRAPSRPSTGSSWRASRLTAKRRWSPCSSTFTFPSAPFLSRLNVHRPGLPVVGGLAVGGEGPGEQALILDGEVHYQRRGRGGGLRRSGADGRLAGLRPVRP